MDIAVVSDLHGLRPRFEKAKKLLEKGIKKLLIAGDIAPLGYPEAQQSLDHDSRPQPFCSR